MRIYNDSGGGASELKFYYKTVEKVSVTTDGSGQGVFNSTGGSFIFNNSMDITGDLDASGSATIGGSVSIGNQTVYGRYEIDIPADADLDAGANESYIMFSDALDDRINRMEVGVDGQVVYMMCKNNVTITITHGDASGSGYAGFMTLDDNDWVLDWSEIVMCMYNSARGKWHIINNK